MCGIVGIVSKEKQDLISLAITALQDLEYRGYDSAGLGFVDGDTLKTYKCIGAPSEKLHKETVLSHTKTKSPHIQLIVGHNRWATHGKPSVQNAHPHTDCSGRVALVHNGTILNFDALKQSLVSQGHVFTSETDTEVIAHCIEEARIQGSSFTDAFVHTLSLLEGSYGVVAIDAETPERLYVAKSGSPISIGMTNTAFFVTSSVHALLRHTMEHIALGEMEFAILSAEHGVLHKEIHHLTQRTPFIEKHFKTIEGACVKELSKDGFETYMLKEIFEQPKTTKATLLGRCNKKTGDAVLGGIVELENFLPTLRNIYTIGCGTAHNAGKVGSALIQEMTDIYVHSEIASEFRTKPLNLRPSDTLALFISQSGETADTREALTKSHALGYKTCGIVNVVGSTISTVAETGEYTRAGVEVGVASTKAFTAQLAVLYLLSLKLARTRGMEKVEGVHFLKTLESIPKHMETVLTLDKEIQKIVRMFKRIHNVTFLGRGIHVPIADEAALKFKELTYMEAGSYPLGELKHGPLAIVDTHSLSVIIMPKDELFSLSRNSVEQILSKGGKVLIVTDKSAEHDPLIQKADATIFIPTLPHSVCYPFIEIIPLQLFAYHFAKQMGRNVDKPRNLAKSVTVE